MKISVSHTRKEELSEELTQIEVYDNRLKFSELVTVEKLTENNFRVAENAVLITRLKFGTEFEAKINQGGQYEIIKIKKRSEFKTTTYFLSPKFTESEYRVLGDEIMKQGGYWQVDFGSIATVSLPKDSTLDIDEICRIFVLYPKEPTVE